MNANVVAPVVQIQPLAPGPNSLAAIFTLTGNSGLQGFDAAQVPAPIAARVAVSTLARLDPQILSMAVTVAHTRTHILQYLVTNFDIGYPRAIGVPSYSASTSHKSRYGAIGC